MYAFPTKTSISLQANENRLTAKAGADKFYGGYAFAEQMAGGTHVPLSTAETNANIVTIAAGSGTFKFDSAGGYNTLRATKAAAVTTAANANKLTIAGGTFKETVYGGKTSAITEDATGTATATARGNELWANGGTFQRNVLAGWGNATTKAGTATTTASENKLHLAGAAAFPTDGTTVYITGGDASVSSETGKLSLTTEKNSIDGTLTSATSVVRGADGKLDQLAAAGGQAITASAAENTVTLTGGKAFQVDGSRLLLSRAAGAADLHAAKNRVVLTNAASESDSNVTFRGSYIEAHDAKGSLQIRAEENTATADGAALKANEMYGSHVQLRNSNAGTTAATVTANRALMRGKKADTLAGGYADIISSENAALTVKLTGNMAEVQSGTSYHAYGAFAKTEQKDGAGEVTAEGNTITVTKLTDDGGSFTGAKLVYERDGAATAAGDTTLIARSNKADLNEGKLSKLFGAEIRINNAFGGAAAYTATENAVTVAAAGVVTDRVAGAEIEQQNNSADGASFTATAAKNTVANTGGTVKNAMGAAVTLHADHAGDVQATLTENAVTGTGGTFAGDVRGGVADVFAKTGTATATLTKNTVDLTNAVLDDAHIRAGHAVARTRAAGKTASAASNENVLQLKNASGTANNLIGGNAYIEADLGGATAAADKNSVTALGGTLTAANKVYGGKTEAVGQDAPVTAAATANTVTLSAAAPWQAVYGADTYATAVNAAATARTEGNTVTANAGTFLGQLYGGNSYAGTNSAGSGTPGTAAAVTTGNTLNLAAAAVTNGESYGGYAAAGSTTGDVSLTVTQNKVLGTHGTTAEVDGAYGTLAQTAATTRTVTGTLAENTLTLTNGKAGSAYGGFLRLGKAFGAAELTAAKNSAALTDVESASSAALAGSSIEARNAAGNLKLTAKENTITARGADLSADKIYGSHILAQNVNVGKTEILAEKNRASAAGKEIANLAGSYAEMYTNASADLTATFRENSAEGSGTKLEGVYGIDTSVRQTDGTAAVIAERNAATVTKANAVGSIHGAYINYRRDPSATAAADTALTATGNTARLVEGTAESMSGVNMTATNAFGGATTYTATENAATIEAKGVVTSSAYGAYLSQETSSEDGASFTAHVAKNRVTSTGGAVKDAYGALAALRVNNAGNASATLTENAVTGTGGTFANKLYGGWAELISTKSAATAALTKNTVKLTNTKLDDARIHTGYAVVITKAAGKTASAAAHENVLLLKNASGTVQALIGGVADGTAERAGAAAAADSNSITAEGGTLTAASDVYGGTVGAVGKDAPVTASASKNTVTLSAAAPWRQVRGGRANANADGAAATATANENTLNLAYGTFTSEIIGGYATADGAPAQATANKNTVNISGGIYQDSIYAGEANAGSAAGSVATVKDNRIVITGTPNLSAAQLHGHKAVGATKNIAGNALVVKETKGIKADSIDGFQKLEFWLPAGMTKDDTMLWLSSTSNTNLTGTDITAHLRGDETEKRLRLLYTEKAQIQKDGTTTMTVWKGVSDVTTAKIGITKDNKELIVKTDGSAIDEGDKPTPKPPPTPPTPPTPPPTPPTPPTPPPTPPTPPTPPPTPPTPPPTPPTPTPTPDPKQQVLDNRKSVVETMAGAVAFLGAGADLAAGGGMASASVEAAAAEGFAPFAAIGGSSMRHETGSHVNMKGLNLAVGFSREVKRGDDRLIFGPIVEYGRGTYDSYVNDAHGDGSVRYVGIGGFVRQEQKDGMFYEGSLRFGRSSMDYSAILSGTPTTYDTDANYIGAHLGVGQRIQEQSGMDRELYLRYFYARQNGTDTKLSTGERYDFDAVDSHRLRAGARWLIPQKGGSLILGASLQYEFGGESRATVHVGGNSYTTPAPSLNGFSTSLELGWKTQMSKNATADLSIEGWFGKQRGVSARAGFSWQF